MREELTNFELNFRQAYDFLSDNLSGVNLFCDLILKNIDFQKGSFFTILPSETNEENIHQFKIGGIATGVRNFTRGYVYKSLMMNKNLSFVIDSYNETFEEGYDTPLFQLHGYSYKNELYYILNESDVSKDAVTSCFQASDTIWHSLSVLTNFQVNIPPNATLHEQDLNKIVDNTELIITQAYDQEGYIFWRKH